MIVYYFFKPNYVNYCIYFLIFNSNNSFKNYLLKLNYQLLLNTSIKCFKLIYSYFLEKITSFINFNLSFFVFIFYINIISNLIRLINQYFKPIS